MLSGCSTANVSFPGGGAGFSRVMTDAQITYARGADGSVSLTYTSAPNAMAGQALDLARTLAAVIARGSVPVPAMVAMPEKLMAPEGNGR